jgi:hypothetical protein
MKIIQEHITPVGMPRQERKKVSRAVAGRPRCLYYFLSG